MKPIEVIYPKIVDQLKEEGGRVYVSDYDPLLESLGYEILLKVDDNNYRGDSRLLLKEGSSYGVLIFGWGSCTGCDYLQSCRSVEEIKELRAELKESIKWFDTKKACLNYFTTHDWEGDYNYYEETKDFIKQAKHLLRG